jgi:hypothetical protein
MLELVVLVLVGVVGVSHRLRPDGVVLVADFGAGKVTVTTFGSAFLGVVGVDDEDRLRLALDR